MEDLGNLFVRLMLPYPKAAGIKVGKFMHEHRRLIKVMESALINAFNGTFLILNRSWEMLVIGETSKL